MSQKTTYINEEERQIVSKASFVTKLMNMSADKAANFYKITSEDWEAMCNFEKAFPVEAIAIYEPLLKAFDDCVAIFEGHHESFQVSWADDETFLALVDDVRGGLNDIALIKANRLALKNYLKKTEAERKRKQKEAMEMTKAWAAYVEDEPCPNKVILNP